MLSRLLSILIFTFFLGPSSLSCEEGTQASHQTEELAVPNPFHLDPAWWNYYAVKMPLFMERVTKTREELNKILAGVEEAKRKDIEVLSQRFLTNLEVLPKVENQPVKPFVIEPFQDTYSLDEELAVALELREFQLKDDDFNKEILRLQDRSNKLEKHLDTLFASYLQMNEPNLEKLKAGLEMMGLRAALQLTNAELHVTRSMDEENQKAIDFKSEELAKAQANLQLNHFNLEELQQKIAKAEENVKITQLLALRAETDALGPPGENLKERLDRAYLTQRATHAAVNEALANADLLFEQIKLAYLLQLQAPHDQNSEGLSNQVKQWKKSLGHIKNQSREWKEKLEEEVKHTGNAYLVGESDLGLSSQDLMRLQQNWYREVQQTLVTLQALGVKIFISNQILDHFSQALKTANPPIVNWWNDSLDFLVGCCSPFYIWMNSSLLKIGDIPLTPLSLLHVCLILLIAYLVSVVIRMMLARVTKQHEWVAQSSLFLLNRLIHYLILFIGISIALSSIGLNFSNLALVLGALSVGIGFGLQTIVNNFFSSLLILFTRPFKIGDYIETPSGKYGKVSDVTIQHTVIHLSDGIDVIVPNSQMISQQVTNWTKQDGCVRLHIPFTIPRGGDREGICRLVEESALKVPCTMKGFEQYEDPKVWLIGFTEDSLDLELVVWANVYSYGHRGSITASYMWEIEAALAPLKLAKPTPQMDLSIRSCVPLTVNN